MINLIRTTDATEEPITLAEMKIYLKVDNDTDDNLISGLISGARNLIETECDYFCVLPQVWTEKTDEYSDGEIYLHAHPVSTVSSVVLTEIDKSTTSLVEDTDYYVSGQYLYEIDGGKFDSGRRADAYTIVYYADKSGTTATVPNEIKVAMYRLISFWYENREEYATQIIEAGWHTAYQFMPNWFYGLIKNHRTGNII